MGLETKNKNIDGIVVDVTQFQPLKGAALGFRVLKALGPSLVRLLPMMGAETKEEALGILLNSDLDALGMSLAALNPPDLDYILRASLEDARATSNGARTELNSDDNINAAFAGKTPALIKAAAFSLQVNFAGFFPGGSKNSPGDSNTPTPVKG
jgi:hypothetical protein